jgi:hypothetical protein
MEVVKLRKSILMFEWNGSCVISIMDFPGSQSMIQRKFPVGQMKYMLWANTDEQSICLLSQDHK